MAFDATIGYLLDDEARDEAWFAAILAELAATLRAHGLPPHHEPRSWDEVWARHEPGKRRRPRELGVRLGFYGGEKYGNLVDLSTYAAVHGEPPERLPCAAPEAEYEAIAARERCFDHLQASLVMSTVVLPLEFTPVLMASGPRVGRVISARRLLAEADVLAHCLGRDGDQRDGKYAAALAERGLRRRHPPEAWTAWGEELDLCHRLGEVAKQVLWSGALALTN